MSSIDTRIVEMRFNNSQFEQGVKTTLTSLDNLNKGLKLDGATKGLDDVSVAAKKFSIAGMAEGVDAIASKFSALSVVALTALTNITNKAVNAGFQLVKSLTIDPVKSGLDEYETNLNSIQTILANTGLEGAKGLGKVNKALAELNTYSDQTIYNFSEMARNIGTFTAAGVKLDTATAAIKGIANLAALSGSNSQQASTAMYQLSQALAAGKVALIDWNSVVNAGMGGKVFQEALKETARNQGVAIDSIIKKNGSFRDSLQKGWLTSKVLTETLSKFTGDLTAAQLKTMGYNNQQIAGILKMGKVAKDAATKVKTMSQLIGTLQEAAGSGWAQTWQLVFGDFDEAKVLFTGVNNVLGGMISASAEARNKVLGDWKALGGRTALIDSVANAFHTLIAVLKPIGDAFRQIFPATTGKQLYGMTVALRDFTAGLKIGGETATNLQRTFAGVFAVFHIGFTILGEVVKLFARLFGVVGEGSGGFLKTTGSIGDFLVAVDKALSRGGLLEKVFGKIGDVLEVPINLVKTFANAIGSMFDKADFGGVESGITALSVRLGSLANIGDLVKSAWTKVVSVLGTVWSAFVTLASKIANASGDVGQALADAFSNMDFGDILGVINTGLFAALALGIRKLFKSLMSSGDGAPGFFDSIRGSFDQLTGTLTAMQNTLKATTLLEIAAAIGILTLSVVALSKIDSEGLTRALTAMTVMFTQLTASMFILTKFSSTGGFAKLPIVASSMILIAIAVDILAAAVKKLADIDEEGLKRGLDAVIQLITALTISTRLMKTNTPGMVTSAAALVVIAVAIRILTGAVKDLSGLSWEELSKGLVGVGTLLGALILFTKFAEANKGGVVQGAGIILLAVGIKILASAVEDFSNLSWEELAKGLIGMSVALLAIGAALALMPPSSILSGAAILIVAASLGMIADALEQMGGMDWENIAKGLVAMAGSLLIIAVAMAGMTTALPGAAALLIVAVALKVLAPVLQEFGDMDWENIAKAMVVLTGSLLLITAAMIGMTAALPGAAALLIVAAALQILAPVLIAFGNMSWESIVKGLLTLADVFLVIGVAGLVLGPLVPVLIGLGYAITLLGIGMLAAGVGVLAFSIGLTALAAAGAAGAAAIIGIVTGLIGLIPMLMKQIGLGIVAFATVLATAGPAIFKAMTAVMGAMIDAIATLTPKIVKTLLNLIVLLLEELAKAVPKMVSSGAKLIIGILDGIADNISGMVTAASNVIVKFIEGISANQGRVIDAGVKMIISFINGVADAIRNNSEQMSAAGANLGIAIVEGMAKGIAGGIGVITNKARDVALSALNAARSALGVASPSKEFEKVGKFVIDGFANGLTGNKGQVAAAYKEMHDLLSTAMKAANEDVDNAAEKLTKLTSARKKDQDAINSTRAALAQAKAEQALATSADSVLMQGLQDERNTLEILATQYDVITDRIKNAESALADAIKTRDDYAKSVADTFASLPSFTGETSLKQYISDLNTQVQEVSQFSMLIQQLRTLGLSDQMYKELLSKGTEALPLVKQIAEGGVGAVNELNSLGSQLDVAAKALGSTASTAMYQAGVDAAKGIVDGLKSSQTEISNTMAKIAKLMVDTLRQQLKIKSPSREMSAIGTFAVAGLVDGLKTATPLVEQATEGVGKSIIVAMQKSISGMSDLISGDMDLTPTITPILDLSNVEQNTAKINDMFSGMAVSVGANYSSATAASRGFDTNNATQSTVPSGDTSSTITFVQNNNSPKALSSSEIYRQTKNQLSTAKEALK